MGECLQQLMMISPRCTDKKSATEIVDQKEIESQICGERLMCMIVSEHGGLKQVARVHKNWDHKDP